MKNIIITGAKEGNLKNVSVEIPKNKLTVFTGLSGSGKSTLAVDTLFNECQRQYLEAIGLQGIKKPNVDSISNAGAAILITQNTQSNRNPRSSVGTVTDIYTDIRMIYEKLSKRICPNCNKEILASDCKEELEKDHNSFKVYMYCNHCNHKMEKLTRSHFSYNTREGACRRCEGLGKIMDLNMNNVINEDISLEDGAVAFWDQAYKDYQIGSLYNSFKHYGVEITPNVAVKDFNEGQRRLLFYGAESKEVKEYFPNIETPKTVTKGKFEGVVTVLWRRLSEKGENKNLADYFNNSQCPECSGERLNTLSRNVTVCDVRLPEIVKLSLDELNVWVTKLDASLNDRQKALVNSYIIDLKTKITRIINVGLGYLNLDRQTGTLSGGELQRIKLAAVLDSSLTGLVYIMDEPTIGLHPKDTMGIVNEIKRLRDQENTVILIEHDIDIIKEADFIVDVGPAAGKNGGEIVAVGTLEELMSNDNSVTGKYLKNKVKDKKDYRKIDSGFVEVNNANVHNLKNVSVKFPKNCLTSVTGVSGSGKSSLVFDVLEKQDLSKDFNKVITVEQSPLTRMKRSNIATYSGLYAEIRKIFGSLESAKERGLNQKHFSFNTKGGRCENCEGLGFVVSNMLFFQDIEVVCPICGGKQFKDEVLEVEYKGNSIKDVLNMSIEDALKVFNDSSKIMKLLELLIEVGLGYLELGQSITTISGGEGQRLKLAKELTDNKGKNNLYLLDEPTTGLHPIDVDNFLKLLNKIVDSKNTVIVVEHNTQIIKNSDYVIDLGPEGGISGGEIIAIGTPKDIISSKKSLTGRYIS